MSSKSQSIALDAKAIAAVYSINPNSNLKSAAGQIQHRIDLIQVWDILPGERILEIGCGQGDCTVTLATAVGEEGHVTAIDPAPLDYGRPFTLGQAQAHLSASIVGSRITFVQAEPIAFLQSSSERYTTAVLAHCIWYFASPATLSNILTALSARVDRICLAEYALTATDPRSFPHVVAALTEAALECRKAVTVSNIRTVLSPAAMHTKALEAGLELIREKTITPVEDMFDAVWEVGAVLSDNYVEEINTHVKDERERAVIFAMRDSVRANREAVKARGEKLRTMDVWVSVYKTVSTL